MGQWMAGRYKGLTYSQAGHLQKGRLLHTVELLQNDKLENEPKLVQVGDYRSDLRALKYKVLPFCKQRGGDEKEEETANSPVENLTTLQTFISLNQTDDSNHGANPASYVWITPLVAVLVTLCLIGLVLTLVILYKRTQEQRAAKRKALYGRRRSGVRPTLTKEQIQHPFDFDPLPVNEYAVPQRNDSKNQYTELVFEAGSSPPLVFASGPGPPIYADPGANERSQIFENGYNKLHRSNVSTMSTLQEKSKSIAYDKPAVEPLYCDYDTNDNYAVPQDALELREN